MDYPRSKLLVTNEFRTISSHNTQFDIAGDAFLYNSRIGERGGIHENKPLSQKRLHQFNSTPVTRLGLGDTNHRSILPL